MQALNQVVIWDKFIEFKKDAKLALSNEFVKYALIDQGYELRGKEVSLRLVWDHMPITGMCVCARGPSSRALSHPMASLTSSPWVVCVLVCLCAGRVYSEREQEAHNFTLPAKYKLPS